MTTIEIPPPDASPRDVAQYLLAVLDELGWEGVLVGTTAALAEGDVEIRSRDTDVVAIGTKSLAALKRGLRAVAARDSLEYVEQGWGVVSLVRRRSGAAGDAQPAWVGDVLHPGSGMIPAAAARLVAKHAIKTEWGPAACPEHVVVMKAVAGADRAAEGQPLRVLKYEQHLELLAARRGVDLDWDRARKLLMTYAKGRREGAAELIRDAFGVDLLKEERA